MRPPERAAHAVSGEVSIKVKDNKTAMAVVDTNDTDDDKVLLLSSSLFLAEEVARADHKTGVGL